MMQPERGAWPPGRAWTPAWCTGRGGPAQLPATLPCVARAQRCDPPRGPRRDIRHGRQPPGVPAGGPAAGGRRGERPATPHAGRDAHLLSPDTPDAHPLPRAPGFPREVRSGCPDLPEKHPEFGARGSSSGFITTVSSRRVPGCGGQALLPDRPCAPSRVLCAALLLRPRLRSECGGRPGWGLTRGSRTARPVPSGRKLGSAHRVRLSRGSHLELDSFQIEFQEERVRGSARGTVPKMCS